MSKVGVMKIHGKSQGASTCWISLCDRLCIYIPLNFRINDTVAGRVLMTTFFNENESYHKEQKEQNVTYYGYQSKSDLKNISIDETALTKAMQNAMQIHLDATIASITTSYFNNDPDAPIELIMEYAGLPKSKLSY